ncbi:hypothetical protein [Halopiger xanaduensis]|uniref:Glycosyltransferase RgtA/B/C/D-like domain-containing protein n=1 Tax=Halopiger xanaduensis (strain DSM 18323 / JCM 14033 / SH-6) TaxID=797210 RepID=F8DD52_HALXS|nr:hypothetical protein [Halopiger xanaduensis]AEH38939.1 hypothetical protein Halxa_0336 [Halopiger xanaduensis SH-6]
MVDNRRTYAEKIAIIGCCLALSIGTLITVLTPANGYELSIYKATPAIVWVLLLFSLVISVIVAFATLSRRIRWVGIGIAWTAAIVLTALPYLRGYWLYGRFDPMNHHGIVIDLTYNINPLETTIYPNMHILAHTISTITGINSNRALLLIPPLFVLIYCFGIYTVVGRVSRTTLGRTIGATVPLTFMWIIGVRHPKVVPAPTVAALLLLPFVLFAVILAYQQTTTGSRITAIGVLVAFVFYHPQHTVVLLGGLLFLFAAKKIELPKRRPTTTSTTIFSLAVIEGVVTVYWLLSRPQIAGTIQGTILSLQHSASVSNATPAKSGLQMVGGSLLELAIKVLLPKGILALSVAVLVVLYLYNRELSIFRLPTVWLCIGIACSAVAFSLLFAVIGMRSQMFRYIGLLSTLAAISFAVLGGEYSPRFPTAFRSAIVVIIVVAMIATVPIMYQSDYTYQPNNQVTESSVNGYEFAFENSNADIGDIRTIENRPSRFVHTIYGKHHSNQLGYISWQSQRRIVLPHFQATTLNESGYLMITDYAEEQHVELYQGLRYSEKDFNRVAASADQIYSSKGATLYRTGVRSNSSQRAEELSNLTSERR